LNKSLRVEAYLIDLKVLHELFSFVLDHEEICEISVIDFEVGFSDTEIAVKCVLSDSDTDLRISENQIVFIIDKAVFFFEEIRL
jgi:hypothetical protein